jgi:hypothetical protein
MYSNTLDTLEELRENNWTNKEIRCGEQPVSALHVVNSEGMRRMNATSRHGACGDRITTNIKNL